MELRSALAGAVEQAWDSLERASVPPRVSPSVPILFFGDLDAYERSPLRIVTVGLNPSLKEFPEGSAFQRFPLAARAARTDHDRYLDALSAYFRTDPYRKWFNHWEPFLNGAEASYFGREASTALHTDMCSAVATDPTWDKLCHAQSTRLLEVGVPLWHELLHVLRPHIVAISVAKDYTSHIEFEALGEWKTVHTFNRKKNGALRAHPYNVEARWHEIGGHRSLFVFGRQANVPIGSISREQRHEMGTLALKEWR